MDRVLMSDLSVRHLTMIEFGSWLESAGSEMGMRPEHMVRMSRDL